MANAPVLTSKNTEEYVAFVDQLVHAFLPDKNENPERLKLYQLHNIQKHVKNIKKNLVGLNLERYSKKKQ